MTRYFCFQFLNRYYLF